jgi:hypothetical protein
MALSVKHLRAIQALLSSATLDQAAEKAGVDPVTLRRWRRQPTFQRALQQACQDSMALFQERVQLLTGHALSVLLAVAADPRQPAAARVAACRTIIESALRTQDLQGLRERLAALETELRTSALPLDGLEESAVNTLLADVLGLSRHDLPD